MEKYAFKIMGPGGSENGKWIKLFSSSEEVASLRIQVRFPSLKKETLLSMSNTMMKKRYIDIDVVPTDDLDSFIDMFETAQQDVMPDVITPCLTTSAGSALPRNVKKRPKATTSRPRCLEGEFSTACESCISV